MPPCRDRSPGTRLCGLLLIALLGVAAAPPALAALDPAQVPAALAPWVDWVLGDEDRRACTLDPDGEPLCAWPGRLNLTIDAKGGQFAQHWELDAPQWVVLPGDASVWPQGVTIDKAPAPVLERDGRPALWLEPGAWEVAGRFDWPRRPDGLLLPEHTALLKLSVDGVPVPNPRIDAERRLWLAAGPTATPDPAQGAEPDSVALEVSRRIDDGAPLLVTTQLALDVAGQPRELRLGPALLAGGIPLALDSPLPTRLDEQGVLVVQARPGRWTLTLTTQHPGPVDALTLGQPAAPWPGQEVWVFQAAPALRQVEVKGAEPVDPTQTRLPPAWQRLPAWLLAPGETLELATIQRGAVAADRLSLDRELRLDFGGGGFSLRDRISGQLEQRWRLTALAPLQLGQVQVDGEPRLITRLPDDADGGPGGIEVRQGQLQLVADARLDTPTGFVTRLPAAGWALAFDAVETTLNLPPGWDLLAVAGVDNLPDSWLARWSLLDIFLVLIAALAVARLWGWPWGLLALAALVLSWPQPDAPRLIWLHVLGAAALLRVLPRAPARAAFATLRTLVALYYRGALLVLAVIAVPFLVGELRDGLFPQLASPNGGSIGGAGFGVAMAPPPPAPAPAILRDEAQSADSSVYEYAREKAGAVLAPQRPASAPRPLPTLDPDARVQTGAGVPDWHWQTFRLRVNGPVAAEQQVRLWLLPPWTALPLAIARVLLVLLLALRLADLLRPRAPSPTTPAAPKPPRMALRMLSVLAVLGSLGALAPSGDALAQTDPLPFEPERTAPAVIVAAFPPAELLDELRERLLEPPDCLPGCATIALLHLEVDGNDLRLGLVVDAAVPVALPVPGGAGGWQPTWVAVDEGARDALSRTPDGVLLLPIPAGHHGVLLSGPLPASGEVQLPLPLRPRLVVTHLGDRWRLDGVAPNGQPGPQLRLFRESLADGGAPPPPAADAPVVLPPLLKVTRTLRLGLDWTLATRVERLSPPDAAVALPVPLLPGEAVTTPERQVKDGAMLVTLPPGRLEDAWSATLTPVDALTLTAPADPRLTEEWRLEASPVWHVTMAGIPPLQPDASADPGVVVWRPWPREQLDLTMVRPIPVPGPTLTLDRAVYRSTPGRRGSEASLALTLRSSQGGRHHLDLPAGAELTRLAIDGESRPLVMQAGGVDLPLVPGSQAVELDWRTPATIASRYRPAPVGLGTSGVNLAVAVDPAPERWVLWVSGPPGTPTLGPAVLFWPLLAVLALLAVAFARLGLTPLKSWDWLLLGVGLSQAGIWSAALVTLWLFALGLRRRLDPARPRWQFNLAQIGLGLLSLAALVALLAAVEQGLLGAPAMQIAGNESGATHLQWYLDRGGPLTPTVTVWSVSIWVYRALMLAWALWLAFKLLDWLRWGWQGFATPTLWRERPPKDANGAPLSVDL